MSGIPRRLAYAIAFSLLLHGAPLVSWPDVAPKPQPAAPIRVKLRTPAPLPTADLPLSLTDPKTTEAPGKPPPPSPTKPPPKPADQLRRPSSAPRPTSSWSQVVRQHLKALHTRGQFYPEEAIRLGQQGSVLVLMAVDESGAVAAARVEESSGYPLLDAAALRAVRSLRSLPADAPREALLPVRFSLH